MDELIEINLDGNKYRLRADENPELIREAARLVNSQLDEVRKNSKTHSPFQVALLGALNLALKLKKASRDVEQFKDQVRGDIDSITDVLEEEIRSVEPLASGSAT